MWPSINFYLPRAIINAMFEVTSCCDTYPCRILSCIVLTTSMFTFSLFYNELNCILYFILFCPALKLISSVVLGLGLYKTRDHVFDLPGIYLSLFSNVYLFLSIAYCKHEMRMHTYTGRNSSVVHVV